MDHASPAAVTARELELALVGERLSALRLRPPETLREMERSLSRHGQLGAVVCCRAAGTIEIVDGFKRLIAARTMGWRTLRAEIHDVTTGPVAKLLLWQSNAGQKLSELEEAWLVRALYRDDQLNQPQIAQLLGRHKSWVCRRLVLAEGLTDAVESDVRLGLVSATAAHDIGRLRRCNQAAVAQVIARRGLTTRQTTQLVDQLVAAPDDAIRTALLAEAERTSPPPRLPGPRRAPMTPGEAMIADVTVLSFRATRLHTRLLERPLASLGLEVERIVAHRLDELRLVLDALCRKLTSVSTAAAATEACHGA